MKVFGWEMYRESRQEGFSEDIVWKVTPKNTELFQKVQEASQYNDQAVFEGTRPQVLLLSRPTAVIGLLIEELKRKKTPFLYLNPDEFLDGGQIHFEDRRLFLSYKKQSVDLSSIRSAYVDYSELMEVYHFQRGGLDQKERIVVSRWLQFFEGLESHIPNWYPCKPSLLKFESQNKYSDAIEARKLGLNIPDMVYSNKGSEIKKFLSQKKVMLKETGIHFFEGSKKRLFYFHSDLVAKSKVPARLQAPCLFQEYIEKKYEVRAVVLNKKVYGVRISSPKNLKVTNWKSKEHELEFSPYKIPGTIQKKLVQLAELRGLSLATIDLIRTPRGKYVFIEMNRPGQWLFLELLSGVVFSQKLVQSLISK